MADISKVKVGDQEYGLKDATARQTLSTLGTKVDSVDGKCDQILERLGEVDDALDDLNGEEV